MLNERGFLFRVSIFEKLVLFSKASIPKASIPTQTPIQWVPVISSRSVKLSTLSSAKAKNEWRCNFITPYAFVTCKDAAARHGEVLRPCSYTCSVCVSLLSAVCVVGQCGNLCNMQTVGTCAICRQLELVQYADSLNMQTV